MHSSSRSLHLKGWNLVLLWLSCLHLRTRRPFGHRPPKRDEVMIFFPRSHNFTPSKIESNVARCYFQWKMISLEPKKRALKGFFWANGSRISCVTLNMAQKTVIFRREKSKVDNFGFDFLVTVFSAPTSESELGKRATEWGRKKVGNFLSLPPPPSFAIQRSLNRRLGRKRQDIWVESRGKKCEWPVKCRVTRWLLFSAGVKLLL